MKLLVVVLLVIAVLFFVFEFLRLYKDCVDIFKEHACVHGINVDGQWFTTAFKLTTYLYFSKGMLFGDTQFEYTYHALSWL